MGRTDTLIPVYEDKLVQLYSDRIVFRNYYFPIGMSKVVPIIYFGNLEIMTPTIVNGKYRIWGSGNLLTWFPLDGGRSRRDKIFRLTLTSQKIKIGFSVENCALFELALKNLKIV